ncbi:TOBE domain-containing protein [Ruegeria hyattellae]|uniref:TOBE domain-containing protein n=1 Tax=Ruegeria hyattellae TaxID=3233337 RepID=UPI00355C8428
MTIDESVGISIGSACVDRMEDLGHDALVRLTTSNGAVLTVRIGGEIRGRVVPGQKVAVGIRPEHLHVFRVEGGERL